MFKTITTNIKILRIVIDLIVKFSGFYVHDLFHGSDINYYQKVRKKFARNVLRTLDIHVSVVGDIPKEKDVLFVGNHLTMMDPVIFLAYINAWPIAKAEINKYPILGPASEKTGVLFVNRSNLRSRYNTKEALKQKLMQGESILIYPEGTVSKTTELLPFKKGSFIVAAELGTWVCPTHIQYPDHSYRWPSGSLYRHVKDVFIGKTSEVHMTLHPQIRSQNKDLLCHISFALLSE